MPNPLTEPWSGPYGGVPPWHHVKIEDFPAAFEQGLAEERASVERIALQVRHWQRTEVGEAEEAFAKGQKGS